MLFKNEIFIMVLEPLSPSSFELVHGSIFSHQHRVFCVPDEFLFTEIFQFIRIMDSKLRDLPKTYEEGILLYDLSPNPHLLCHNIIIHRVKTSLMNLNSPLKFVAFIHRNENLGLQVENTRRKHYQYIFPCNVTLHHH